MERQKKAWDILYNGKYGLKSWCAYAQLHNKRFMIPEWGLWRTKEGKGGTDNPYFVQQMFNFIYDPANHVYEAAYWDSRESKVIPTGGIVSQYPMSADLFRKLFSLPSSTAPATATTSPSSTVPAPITN